MRILFVFIAAMVALTCWVVNRSDRDGSLDAILEAEQATGAILIRRLSDGAEWTGGGARIDQRFLPASTYKIPNSLILLQSGVVSDPDTDLMVWDGVERGGGWDQDQSLRAGLRRSALWAYQAWARELGPERMQARLATLGYGNGQSGGPDQIDTFWLLGPLEISAREQVDFLERLHARALPLDEAVQEQVVDMLVFRRGPDWVLRAKTGWAVRDDPNLGWLVGWLEANEDVWVFAVNVDLDWDRDDGSVRERLALAALIAAGAPDAG